MDAAQERRIRFRFGLRTLLGLVALVGLALYFRPGQVDAIDAPIGATKAWVYWNCGPPEGGRDAYPDDLWVYEVTKGKPGAWNPHWNVIFDANSGRVTDTIEWDFYGGFSR